MTKDKKPLPFEQLTVGNLIALLERQLPTMYRIEINGGNKLTNLMSRAQAGIQIMKEKFRGRMEEWVYLNPNNTQINIMTIADIEAGKDIHWFSTQRVDATKGGYQSTNFPLMRLKKGLKQECANSGPQWLVLRLQKGTDSNNAGEQHLMDSFVSRFNYDYVYEYYFGKSKPVMPYKPLGM